MLRVRAEEPCRDRTAMLVLLLKGVSYGFSEVEGEVVVPCDILESEYPEFLVPVFVALRLRKVELVEVGIDPGASRSGVVVLAGDEVVYRGVLLTSKLPYSLERLSRYYRLRVYLGTGAHPFSLEAFQWGDRVEVVEVEERDLPIVEGVELGKDHEVDALRILIKGKLIKMRKSLGNTPRG
ncbi:MAG: hypothetical protein LM563_00135 [Thermofilum sp.]|nr:hypothetical protein [Thermofilum sp.]